MVELEDYLNYDTVVKDQFYESIKESLFCPICMDLMIKPVMCMNCTNNYCRRCIMRWSKFKNICPNRCENTEYKKCVFVENILIKLKFKCKDCYSIISYDNMEKHVLSKCDTVKINLPLDKNSSEINGIFRKINLKNTNNKKINEQIKLNMKILFLGPSEVGKTSLINSFINGEQCLDQLATTGVENNYSKFTLADGTYVSCNFIDSGGALRFRATNEYLYRKVDGCILVFDLTDRKSFDDIKDYFIPKVQELCKENIPVLILGNKKEMVDSRVISYEEGDELALKYEYNYREVSCVENDNLDQIFEDIIEKARVYIKNKDHYGNELIDNNLSINDAISIQLNNRNENNQPNQQRRRCTKCW
jgi:small GTP-binding protein